MSNCLWPPWAVAYQAPLSMEFSRRKYWSGLPFPSPGDLSDPGIKPGSPCVAGRRLPIWTTRETPSPGKTTQKWGWGLSVSKPGMAPRNCWGEKSVCVDDLGKFRGKEGMDTKSEFWLVCAISSERRHLPSPPVPAGWTLSRFCRWHLQCTVLFRSGTTGCQFLERDLAPGHWKTESSFASLRKGGMS